MDENYRRNNLDRSASPYLRQHQNNPVWWQEWSTGVLAAAAARKRPLFVSVGYSACHWCHVMAGEAFSDPATAEFLNRHFTCVKVDRETRPDIDQYLMRFLLAQSGSGGWPLNVFLTCDLKPVFALTYAPARAGAGMPPLAALAEKVLAYLRSHEADIRPFLPGEEKPVAVPEDSVRAGLLAGLDPRHGGFGSGQKFPPHSTLLFMLYRLCLGADAELAAACRLTLDAMRLGGLHDHLQGGIFRYCVDPEWTIPHFEKMLYDQAMALWSFALAEKVLGGGRYGDMALGVARCLEETFALDGLLATAFDADTDHHEGSTYVWQFGEIKAALSAGEFARFAASYRLPEQGNFAGAIHLTRTDDRPLRDIELKLLTRRRLRPQPALDDKILCGLNALAACAMVQAARLLGRPELEEKAARIVDRLLAVFWDGSSLAHCLAGGVLQKQGFLSDAAALLLAVTLLREGDAGRAGIQKSLVDYALSFRRNGAWCESDIDDFQAVPASWFDQPLPSGVSLAAMALSRAAVLDGSAPERLEYLPPLQSDFYNIAAMFNQGLFHQVHSPAAIAWSRLPANAIQVRGKTEMDCYLNQCRPLSF